MVQIQWLLEFVKHARTGIGYGLDNVKVMAVFSLWMVSAQAVQWIIITISGYAWTIYNKTAKC